MKVIDKDINEIDWRALALTDSLTGIGNRRALEFDFTVEQHDNYADNSYVALIGIDADGLKSINDSLGHPAGDALICAIANLLACLYPGRVYRNGGDEFQALISIPSSADAVKHARRIKSAFSKAQPVIETGQRPSVSVGWAVAPKPASLALLLKDADIAMYRAKIKSRRRRSESRMLRLQSDVKRQDSRPIGKTNKTGNRKNGVSRSFSFNARTDATQQKATHQ